MNYSLQCIILLIMRLFIFSEISRSECIQWCLPRNNNIIIWADWKRGLCADQILDDKSVRRRFCASNYQSTTRVKPFICTMPMRLDDGWNQIQFNLSDFTRRAYGTNYIETLRVQVPTSTLINLNNINIIIITRKKQSEIAQPLLGMCNTARLPWVMTLLST